MTTDMPTLLNDVTNVIRKHQTRAPVSVVPIAEALGLKVYRVDGWSDEISGKIERNAEYGGPSGFAIFVNKQHPKTRRRYTIAHEIAHFALHRDLIGDELIDDSLYRSGLRASLETEANKTAQDILMPWHLLNAEIESGTTGVEELAACFDVSPTAMAIRLGVPY